MKRPQLFLLFLLLLPLSATSQWKEMNNGLYGGPIIYLEAIGNKLFAGTTGGLYLSKNNGHSWTLIYESYFEWNINYLLVHKNYIYLSFSNGKTFRSSDEGVSWTELNFGVSIFRLEALGEKLIGGTANGQIYIIDPVTLTSTKVDAITGAGPIAITTTKVFVVTQNGLFVSADSGATWTKDPNISGVLGNLTSHGDAVAVLSGITTMLSLDNGVSWKTVPIPPGGTCVYVEAGIVLVGSGGRSLMTLDKGLTWNPVEGLPGMSHIVRTSTGIFAGNSNGMFRSSNGITWSECNYGIKSANVAAIINQGDHFFATNGNRVYVTNNGTWTNCNLPTQPEEWIYSLVAAGDNVLAGTFNKGVYVTIDKGKTWSKHPTLTGAHHFILEGGVIYAANPSGIYTSNDNGNNWTLLNANVIGVSGMAMLNGYLYVSTIPAGLLAIRRLDSSGNITTLNDGIPLNVQTNSFAAMGDVIYCATNSPWIYTLDNTTLVWSKKGPSIPGTYKNLITHGELMYSYNFIKGVHVSSDKGETWSVYSDGLPKRAAQSFTGHRGLIVLNGDLYLGTSRAGVWTTGSAGQSPNAFARSEENLPDLTLTLNTDEPPFPDDFPGVVTATEPAAVKPMLSLFPNPATNLISISINLLPGMHADVEVLDISGRVLQRDVISADNHPMNVEAYPSGTYIVRAKAAGAVHVGKFVKP